MPQALMTFLYNTVIYPYSPRVHNSYADALRISGDKEAAIAVYEKVLTLDPTYENAIAQLKILKPD
jgi:lipoprotein NlpI